MANGKRGNGEREGEGYRGDNAGRRRAFQCAKLKDHLELSSLGSSDVMEDPSWESSSSEEASLVAS